MSKFLSSVLGGAAVAASLIGVQLAVGHEAVPQTTTNVIAKGDRPAGIVPIAGTTVVTQSVGSSQTTVAIRLPVQKLQQDGKAVGASTVRRPVACEAPASVLTDIAQHLQSGRCLT